jgi:hypothetical protein
MLTKFELGYLALVRGFHAWLFRSAPALAKAKIQQLVHQQFQESPTASLPPERARILPDECRRLV